MVRAPLSARMTSWLAFALLVVAPLKLGHAQEAPAPAEPPETGLKAELQRFLYDEATAVLHLRSYLFDRQNQRPPNLAAIVTGGWVGLQTG